MSDRITDKRIAELVHNPKLVWFEEVPALINEIYERREQDEETP